MSLKKIIKSQVHEIMNNSVTEQCTNVEKIQSDLLNICLTAEPTSIFPYVNQVQSKQTEVVYVSLTVQDILDPEYYYAYLISKPISKESEVVILKYGMQSQDNQKIDIESYHTIMDSRQTLICVGDFYQTNWVQNEWKGPSNFDKLVQLKVSNKNQFKLGEKINAVCVWNPYQKYLVFVRLATQEEIAKWKLNFDAPITDKQLNIKQQRELLIENLNKFCTQSQSLMLLFSMISQQPMFINGQNVFEQISEILPRVSQIKIKAPLKQSLFPFKDQEGKLKRTPMQMSMAKTFVFIDFSNFSKEKQIKIDQPEIDNLRALKMFVQQGKTIFRWQYGESLNDHCHSGIIVKGSKILNPHFYLSEQMVQKQRVKQNPFKDMEVEKKQKIRAYLKNCLNIKSSLSEDSRNKIEAHLKLEIQKQPDAKLMIQEKMQIARLNAKSYGREFIEFEDYIFATELLNDSKQ